VISGCRAKWTPAERSAKNPKTGDLLGKTRGAHHARSTKMAVLVASIDKYVTIARRTSPLLRFALYRTAAVSLVAVDAALRIFLRRAFTLRIPIHPLTPTTMVLVSFRRAIPTRRGFGAFLRGGGQEAREQQQKQAPIHAHTLRCQQGTCLQTATMGSE
jgi:hypothetical protein